jgi:propanol-preferring alcohol dehydrogenase
MEKMTAAVLTAFHEPLRLQEVALPTPEEDEVRLKVLASGLCSTDIHIREGKIDTVIPPRIPGHEIAGEIDLLGSEVEGLSVGARCIVRIDVVCGKCRFCHSDRENLCLNRVRVGFERDGGHAQYVTVPARNLVGISDQLDVTQAAIIPDAVACMLHSLVDQGNLQTDQRVVIIGLGGLAYQGLQIANYFGASVIGTSRRKHKRDLALQLGATGACNTTEEDIRAYAKRAWGEETVDLVLDNVGTQETLALSLSVVRRGGRVVVVGYEVHEAPYNVYDLMLNEKEIVGARGSTMENLQESVRLVETGAVIPLVTNIYTLEDINSALHDLEHGQVVSRAVIAM